jgi:DNA invertase Pin-like site-specific DNA recombinase
VTIFRETISGTKEKPELERLIGQLRAGDTLAVWELSRLTRSGMSALVGITGRVQKAGAVIIETRSGQVIKNDAMGDMYLAMLGLAARIERDMISERTKSALKMRKEKGMTLGRPAGKSKLDEKKVEIMGYQELGMSKAHISRRLGCSRTTYLAWLEKESKGGK